MRILSPKLTYIASARLERAVPTSVEQYERFVDADEAAAFLSISRRRVLDLARRGMLPAHPIGLGARRVWRFRLSEVAAALLDQSRIRFAPRTGHGMVRPRVPDRFREEFGRYCQTHSEDGGKSSALHSPFPRMVDMWFLVVCLGAQEGKSVEYDSIDTYKIIDASIFSSDPWRIDALVLLAIGHTKNVEIVNEPREVLALASGFAVAGMDKLLQMIKDGDSEPVWNLSDELDRLLKTMHASGKHA